MGDKALVEIERMLPKYELIVLDFGGHTPTPSFADQFVGGLAGKLGLDEFRRRIKIANAPSDALSLLRHVILKKAALSGRSGPPRPADSR